MTPIALLRNLSLSFSKPNKPLSSNSKNYVRHNAEVILDSWARLVTEGNWASFQTETKKNQLYQFDKWWELRDFSKIVNQKLRSLVFDSLTQAQQVSLLNALFNIRYNIGFQKPESMFHKGLKDHCQSLEKRNKYDSLLEFTSIGLQSTSEIIKQSALFESYISEKIKIPLWPLQANLVHTIVQGVLVSLWSQHFMITFHQQVQKQLSKCDNMTQSGRLCSTRLKYLHNHLNMALQSNPTQIVSPLAVKDTLETEAAIFKILTELNYDAVRGHLINGIQIDFLIGDCIAVDYNGLQHYYSNGESPILTQRQSWKAAQLAKRGFVWVPIHFYEWKDLSTIRRQRDYLIHKLENTVLDCLRKSDKSLDNLK